VTPRRNCTSCENARSARSLYDFFLRFYFWLTVLWIAGRIVKALALALAILAVGLSVARTVAQHPDPSWQNQSEIRVIPSFVLTEEGLKSIGGDASEKGTLRDSNRILTSTKGELRSSKDNKRKKKKRKRQWRRASNRSTMHAIWICEPTAKWYYQELVAKSDKYNNWAITGRDKKSWGSQ